MTDLYSRNATAFTMTDAQGNDLLLPTEDLNTPLHHMARLNATPEMFQRAVREGADPNALNIHSLPPMAYAILAGQHGNIAALVEAGAELCFTSPTGNTFNALHMALLARRRSTLQAVLKAGGGTYINETGYLPNQARADLPPLFLAIHLGYPEIIPDLIAAGAWLNAGLRNTGETPLATAAKLGNIAAMQRLLAAGADLEHPQQGARGEGEGQTVLFTAIESKKPESLAFLLAAGANPNAQDKNGLTPLHWAMACGHKDMVATLLQAGANSEICDHFNRKAADLTDIRATLNIPAGKKPKDADFVMARVMRDRRP